MLSQEWSYICSLMPLNALPPTLRPTSRSRRPPTMRFAWIINETAKARLLERAHQSPEHVAYENARDNEDDECIERHCPPGEHVHIMEPMTMVCAAELIFEDLGVSLPRSLVGMVSTADESLAFCLTLYTNYELDKALPSQDDIERIRERLGFEGKPQWWPNSRFGWFD